MISVAYWIFVSEISASLPVPKTPVTSTRVIASLASGAKVAASAADTFTEWIVVVPLFSAAIRVRTCWIVALSVWVVMCPAASRLALPSAMRLVGVSAICARGVLLLTVMFTKDAASLPAASCVAATVSPTASV